MHSFKDFKSASYFFDNVLIYIFLKCIYNCDEKYGWEVFCKQWRYLLSIYVFKKKKGTWQIGGKSMWNVQ